MDSAPFAINPAVDVDRAADSFARTGRIHVAEFLAGDGAERLFAYLKDRADWRLLVNQGDKLFELDRVQQAALTPEARRQLDEAVYAAARRGFQYRYETARVPDEAAARAADPTPLNRFATFLSTEAADFLRRITGADDIAFADAQATAYGPGHFLTEHDDGVAGKRRRAAYVFGLSRDWDPDWGGLLTFQTPGSAEAEALIPAFNALNIFRVPQPHSVSFVTPFAPRRRYSVTGWLRARPVP